MTEWHYAIPFLPPKDAGQNAHVERHARDRANAEYRKNVADWLRTQPRPAHPIERCTMSVAAFYCRRRPNHSDPEWLRWYATRRATDLGNLAGDTKALVDAFQPHRVDVSMRTKRGEVVHHGADVIRADDFRHLIELSYEFAEVATFAEERIDVWIVERDD